MTVAGSDRAGLYEPSYKVRLTTNTPGDLRLYLIDFPLYVGTRETSWGAVKKIHR